MAPLGCLRSGSDRSAPKLWGPLPSTRIIETLRAPSIFGRWCERFERYHFSRTILPIVYPEYETTSLIFASLSVFPGFVVMVTVFLCRSTLTLATSGCFRNVFSIPVVRTLRPAESRTTVTPWTATDSSLLKCLEISARRNPSVKYI